MSLIVKLIMHFALIFEITIYFSFFYHKKYKKIFEAEKIQVLGSFSTPQSSHAIQFNAK